MNNLIGAPGRLRSLYIEFGSQYVTNYTTDAFVGYRLTYCEWPIHLNTLKLHPKRETLVYDFFVPPVGLEPTAYDV